MLNLSSESDRDNERYDNDDNVNDDSKTQRYNNEQ